MSDLEESEDVLSLLKRIARDTKETRNLMTQWINAQVDAESEIPEKMRRFITYMHDLHDVGYMYEERGHPIPKHILHELERCDDRYRHLLEDLHADTGAFEKVRQEMTQREGNRWEHGRLLPKETK